MRKNTQHCEDSGEEECQKKQQSTPLAQPRRKRIQKRKVPVKPKEDKVEEYLGINEKIPIQFVDHSENNHNCAICLEVLVKSVTTICGHSYCERCLCEYLLFFDECLQCGKQLRNSRFSYNRVLDNIVQTIVSTLGPDEKQQYQRRCEQSRQYASNKKVKSIEVGEQIDARDRDYVWCKAKIYRSTRRMQQKTRYIFVTYLGKPKSCNEQFCEHSERIASPGFYTSRKDVIRYQTHSNGDLKLKSPFQFNNEQQIVRISPDIESDIE